MKKLLFLSCFLIFSFVAMAQQYQGTNLRGKIVTIDTYYNSQVPLRYAAVGLWQYRWTGTYYQNGQQVWQWYQLLNAQTDANGFYYFYGVVPGNYTLKVNGIKDYPIQVIYIDYSRYQFQDIPILYY